MPPRRVGPNAANLRETSVLSHSYEFRVGAVRMLLCTYGCDLRDVCSDRGSFFDTPADLWETGDLVWTAHGTVRNIVRMFPIWKARGPRQHWTLSVSRTSVSRLGSTLTVPKNLLRNFNNID